MTSYHKFGSYSLNFYFCARMTDAFMNTLSNKWINVFAMYNRNKHSCGVDRALYFFVDDGNLYSFTHNQVLESPSKHISYSWENQMSIR